MRDDTNVNDLQNGARRVPNAEQQAVIDDSENNIILFASAGTGKTFTVANKVKTALKSGEISPEQTLCLTFTIKACDEMKEDICGYTGLKDAVNVKTIHGFCLELIHEEARLSANLFTEPTVYDEVDQEAVLKKLIGEKFTLWCLEERLKNLKICDRAEEILNFNVKYLSPYGFFWETELDGEKHYLYSEGLFLNANQAAPFIARACPEEIVCPACRQRQTAFSNFCESCNFDFRAYVKPFTFGKMKNCRNAVSAVKRHRELFNIYTGNETEDFQLTCEKLKKTYPDLYNALFTVRDELDEQFESAFFTFAGRLVYEYNKILKISNKLDFDDLILNAVRLLKDGAVLNRWQNRYKLVIVDEMQDTSLLEYSVLKNLFAGAQVMMCGDISQTIYGWRGSDPFAILNDFRKNFKAKTYTLSENYRSTKTLALASFNYLKNALPEIFGKYFPEEIKVLKTDGDEPIRCVKLKSERAEAEWIFRYLKKHPPEDPSKICIMSRSNYYISKLYDNFKVINSRLPEAERISFFTVDKDYKFYKKPVIKDFLAFWAVLLNKYDYENSCRLAENYIKGVGRATIAAIELNACSGVSVSAFFEEDTYTSGDCFNSLIEAYYGGNIVVYDVETTGLNVERDQIIQLAAVKLDGAGKVKEKFVKLVVPTADISDGALKTHGFSLEYIKNNGGISPVEALKAFSDFARGCVLVGHNSSKFDRAVVTRQISECGLPPLENCAEYDTLSLAKLLCPDFENYKLETLCKKFNIINERAHDAYFDVLATAKSLSHIVEKIIVPARAERVRVLNKYRKKFQNFYGKYRRMQSFVSQGDLSALNLYIVEKFCLKEKYSTLDDFAAIDDFMRVIKAYTPMYSSCEGVMTALLNEAALSGSQLDFLIKKLNKIPIITVHQSKGCEFDTVIIAGADSLNFPNSNAVKSGNGKEEARVFYVAVSRAKKRLILTSYSDGIRGESPYLKYIPVCFLEKYDFSK